MLLEITLGKPFQLPRVFRANSDEPRQDFHWIGEKKDTLSQTPEPTQHSSPPPKQTEPEKPFYRALNTITLGHVDDAWKSFETQLVPAHENWIGKNYFCTIPLKRKKDGRPPMIFGQVKTCYPSDGQLENIEEIELVFPGKNEAGSLIRIHKDEISRYGQKIVQSYFHRIYCKFSPEETVEFSESEMLFAGQGFLPEPSSEFMDLLELTEEEHTNAPSIILIGSRWLATLPVSIYSDVISRVQNLIHWGKLVINFHPGWLPTEVNSLNRILGYKFEFTPIVLTEPESPKQAAFITAKLFERRILSGNIKKGDDHESRRQEG